MDNIGGVRHTFPMSTRTRRVVYKTEGKVLKQLRKERGWSMRDLADKIGLSDSSVSQWENGRGNFPIESIAKVCKAFGIGEKYFFEMCRDYEKNATDHDYILMHVKKLDETNAKMVRTFMQTLLEKK